MNYGKEKCEILKAIRNYVALKYNLDFEPSECDHQGNCPGTCPKCDAELADLQKQLEAKGIKDIAADEKLSKLVNEYLVARNADQNADEFSHTEGKPSLGDDDHHQLQGIMVPHIEKKEEPKFERKLILECPVAGIGYHDIEDVWDELYVGAKIALVRQKNNKHDKNAVAVALAEDYDGDPEVFDFDYILGYIPRKDNQAIAAMLDMGWQDQLEAEISELNEHAGYEDRLHIKVYILSKEPVEPKDDRLRLKYFNDDEWKSFQDQLFEKGYAYFRWGGFPMQDHDLPKTGDKVVFLYNNGKNATLYLMMTIATGDDSLPYLTHEEETDYVDDCKSFVMTVIKGPVVVKNKDLQFLGDDIEEYSQPDEKLERKVSDQLLCCFEEY